MTAQVAISKDFLASYSKLPKKQQRAVRKFTEKFQHDPTSSGINFERLHQAVDDKVRSVRIDQAYRAIVIHPPKGDVYLLVWVDKHDDAYDWVKSRRFDVNPKSGILQVYDTDVAIAPSEPADPSAEEVAAEYTTRLFDNVDDEDLLLAGVPELLLPSIRALVSDDDLDGIAPSLPEDAADVLYLMAAGEDLITAIEESERSRRPEKIVDTEDFGAALSKPETQRAFRLVEGEDELEAMLDAPLEQWRIFLHPSQRRLVRMNANGPVRVLGGAGTGKTVVLMHRAKHLLDTVFTGENDRILVTTFTKNLALDLRQNLANLCGPKAERLEVIHLHGWAHDFMRKHGHNFRMVSHRKKRQLFSQAITEYDELDLPEAFYLEEWDRVVLSQDVETRDDYFGARRVGRGTRLSRRQRAAVWKVFCRYRELLEESGLSEWADLIRETRLYIENEQIGLPYAAVLSDEVQDFSESGLRLLRTLAPDAPNTLFLVGDGHQRIYGQPVRLGACGIKIRGRARRLKINYRTTEQISARSVSILHDLEVDDLDGGVDTLKGYRSLRSGPVPEMQHFAKENEEAEFIVKRVSEWIDDGVPPESICLAARTNGDIDKRYLPLLKSRDIQGVKVETDPSSEARRKGVRLATMHRLKGLEFSRVLLCGVQAGKLPLTAGDYGDHASEEDHEIKERCLLYVACTRARDELVVTGYGKPCVFLR